MAEKNNSDVYSKQQIGECYLWLNDPISAEFWYTSLCKDPDVNPESKTKISTDIVHEQKV
jgi:hypothetical protein